MHKKIKVYTLSDGTKWTADELAEYLDVPRKAAASRLAQTSDADRVLKPFGLPRISRKIINDVKSRNYYDADGHWKRILNTSLGV